MIAPIAAIKTPTTGPPAIAEKPPSTTADTIPPAIAARGCLRTALSGSTILSEVFAFISPLLSLGVHPNHGRAPPEEPENRRDAGAIAYGIGSSVAVSVP
jgi:hypothetical protein